MNACGGQEHYTKTILAMVQYDGKPVLWLSFSSQGHNWIHLAAEKFLHLLSILWNKSHY